MDFVCSEYNGRHAVWILAKEPMMAVARELAVVIPPKLFTWIDRSRWRPFEILPTERSQIRAVLMNGPKPCE
jgi:hypothetical protein